ncbi:transcriptional regulator [Desulfonema ishimotonii]|uniref:Transcriptional regulator n=1 Tax=Desulfonema ishimotonii TaxID=45657 RepID=A0A401FXD1_9BACT|nr:NadS family protein [Desulfonema ishimotonii]GBC61594.1 transcriptional regulator [Desulfonema ishimotonii]
MNNTFESIKKGLEEAVEYARGNKSGVRVHYPSAPDVRAIRNKTGMSQNEFASTIGISLQTLRYWEKGQRKPKGPVLVLLNIIEKAPDTVMDILSQ